MKTKNKSNSEVFGSTSLRRKPRTSKSHFSQKSKLLTYNGKDAETIRKEVLCAKEKLKERASFFEQLGENDLLKKK